MIIPNLTILRWPPLIFMYIFQDVSTVCFKNFFFSPNNLYDYQSIAFFVAQLVENPPVMRETWVQSLGWEDPLEKEKLTHSNILAWRMPWII